MSANPWCESCYRCINSRCSFYHINVSEKPSKYCDESVHEWRRGYNNKKTAARWFKEYKN